MWVDTDGCESVSQYCKYFLTSVTKNLTGSVQQYVRGGLGCLPDRNSSARSERRHRPAPFHDFASKVPADLKTQLDQVKADIIRARSRSPRRASPS